MNLQNPKKFKMMVDQAHEVALNVLRPISRNMTKPNMPIQKNWICWHH
jgi:acyl-CoA dehydrogenase